VRAILTKEEGMMSTMQFIPERNIPTEKSDGVSRVLGREEDVSAAEKGVSLVIWKTISMREVQGGTFDDFRQSTSFLPLRTSSPEWWQP
jgi:hypothetical protein